MSAMLDWLMGKLAAPLALASAAVLAIALVWQTGRIEGWPLVGGGFKSQVAALQQQAAARDLADARAQAAALLAREKQAAAGAAQARAYAAGDQAIQSQIQTVIREVPVHVSTKSDGECVVPWGAVRLLDAAASGAELGDVAARVAPGVADDAASGISLSRLVALQAENLGLARQNAEQLGALENSTRP